MSEQTDEAVSHAAWRVGQAAETCANAIEAFHATWGAVLKPNLSKDGDMWCAMHGENLQEGVSGFGTNPAKALMAFEIAMCSENGAHVIERKP